MKLLRLQKLLTLSFLFLISSIVSASGTGSGNSCQNAYSQNIGDTINYSFSQQELFIDFVANTDSLWMNFSNNLGKGIKDLESWKLYNASNCTALMLIDSMILFNDSSQMADLFFDQLTIGQKYLLKLKHKTTSPSINFDMSILSFQAGVCQPYNLSCGELITNGGFDNFLIDPNVPGSGFSFSVPF